MKRLFTFGLLLFVLPAGAQTPVRIQYDDWQNGEWIADVRYQCEWNADNTLAHAFGERFDNPDWVHSELYSYAYNSAGQETSSLVRTWNAGLPTWVNDYQSQRTYDAGNYPATFTEQSWASGQWQNDRYTVYTCDASGNVTGSVAQYWNSAGDLVNDTRTDFTYDGSGNLLEEVISDWYNGAWQPFQRMLYTYTPFSAVSTELVQSYGGGVWFDETRATYSYNADETVHTLYWESWNDNDGTWNAQSLTDYSYNANGTLHQWVLQTDFQSAGMLVNDVRATYTYEDELGTDALSETDLVLSPNPATDQLTLSTAGDTEAALVVSDLSGKVLLSETADLALHSLDITALPPGVYLLSLSIDGKGVTRKFVKY